MLNNSERKRTMKQTIRNVDILNVIKLHAADEQEKTMVVMHQANCFNTLHNASGVAAVLANAYPLIAKADDTTAKGDKSKLGTFTYAQVEHKVYIFNVYGQYKYGRQKDIVYTLEDELIKGIQAAKNMATSYGPCTFVVPLYIGAGLGNGNHTSIKERMGEIFKDEEILYVFH